MPSEYSTRFKNRANKIQFQVEKYWKDAWPINWSNFQKPELVVVAMTQAPKAVRAIFAATLVGLVISLGFFTFGVYTILTVEVASSGGEIREGVIGNSFEHFNPVLNTTTEIEEKVIDLLYHPLYKIHYPDFLQEPEKSPTIEPILLKKSPSLSKDRKSLKFELKDNLKWSDNSEFTNDDVIYTFNRLKEDKGNRQFRDIFKDYQLIKSTDSKTNFEIRPSDTSKTISPQFVYLANFSPISKAFFENKNTDSLLGDFKSSRPTVTSGYFTMPSRVKDPNSDRRNEVDNPILDGQKGYTTVVLNKNSNNSGSQIFVETYILKIYTTLTDQGGSQDDSMERATKNGKLDLFNRFIPSDSDLRSSLVKSKLNLNQKILPTNTYFNLYMNIGRGTNLINQTLRTYVACRFLDFKLTDNLALATEAIPKDKRVIPIQFNQSKLPDCDNIEEKLTNWTNQSGVKVYSITKEDTRTGIVRINLNRSPIRLSLYGLKGFEKYNSQIQAYLTKIGLGTDITNIEPGELDTKINEKAYNLIFLPTTVITKDPYPIYGLTGRNISNISQNNRVGTEQEQFGIGIEQKLNTYSQSGLQDKTAKDALTNFFGNEIVSLNLFRSKYEINYSNSIRGVEALPSHITFISQIYNKLPQWYIETKRQIRS